MYRFGGSIVFKYLNYLLILLLSLFIHRHWLFTSILKSHDWEYRYPEQLLQFFVNSEIIFLPGTPIRLLEYFFGLLGYSSQFSDPIIFFIPIVLLPLVVMYLFNRIFPGKYGTFIVGLILIGNTYFLSINAVGHNLITVASYYLYSSILCLLIAIKSNALQIKNPFFLLSVLFILISGIYDFRIFYLGLMITSFIYFFFLIFHEIEFKDILKTISLMISLSLITFIPFIFVSLFLQNSDISAISALSRGLFGMGSSIQKSLTIFHPYWSYEGIEWFTTRNIPAYFYINTIIPFLAILTLKKTKDLMTKKIIILLLCILLLGVFLGKQTAPPFTNFYKLLFHSIPGFSAFREATKFYVLIILGYSMLAGISVNYLFTSKKRLLSFIAVVSTILLIAIYLINIEGIIKSKSPTLYLPSQENQTIQDIRTSLSGEQNPSRILWINLPALYGSTKYEIQTATVDDSSSCNSIKSSNSELMPFAKYISVNRVSRIYINNSLDKGCINELMNNILISKIPEKKYYSDNDYHVSFNEFLPIKPTGYIVTSDSSIKVKYSDEKASYFDKYLSEITFLNVKNSFDFEYPQDYSNSWIAISNNHVLKPSKSTDNQLKWNVNNLEQNSEVTIIIVNYFKIITRILVLLPLSVVFILTITIIKLFFKY